MEIDDVSARPNRVELAEGRRRATPAVTSRRPDATSERVAEALSRSDGRRAGQDILGILGTAPGAAPEATPTPTPTPTTAPTTVPVAVPREHPSAQVGVPTTVELPPKRGVRRLMGTLLVLVLLATAGAGYLAYHRPGPVSTGITATLGVLLLVTWAVRAGTPLTLMTVKGGQLEVRQGGLHLKFDLSSHYTPIDVQGAPGQRDWRVLFGRGSMPPFVVDASIVDADAFMALLTPYRPGTPGSNQ